MTIDSVLTIEEFPHLCSMLTPDNKERVQSFFREDNWCGEGIFAVNPDSVSALNNFIELHQTLFPPKKHISFFLTHSGNIEVVWGEDGVGKGCVEMEFYGDGSIEYLVCDTEGVANQYTGNLFDLLERLRVHQLL